MKNNFTNGKRVLLITMMLSSSSLFAYLNGSTLSKEVSNLSSAMHEMNLTNSFDSLKKRASKKKAVPQPFKANVLSSGCKKESIPTSTYSFDEVRIEALRKLGEVQDRLSSVSLCVKQSTSMEGLKKCNIKNY